MADIATAPESYFDLADVSFSDIFDNCTHVWDALGKLDDYIAAQFETGKVQANYGDEKNIYVGEGTTIEKHVQINGPAIIGANCTISHGAYFRKGCLIGDNVKIGHGCEIKHTIIMNNAAVAHLNIVLDSIIGNNANISGGAATANYRFDKQPVRVRHDGKPIETGLLKFGAIVGDGANVGVNSVLNPGTLLGKNTIVYPLKTVLGAHPPDSVVK